MKKMELGVSNMEVDNEPINQKAKIDQNQEAKVVTIVDEVEEVEQRQEILPLEAIYTIKKLSIVVMPEDRS